MTLIVVFFLISCGLTAATYYFSDMYLNHWWIIAIPVLVYVYFLACFATWLILLFLAGLFVKSDENYIYKPHRWAQWVVRRTARVILLLLGTSVHISGLGKLPAKGPVIIVHNHLSSFDDFALAAFFPRRIVFISKPQNFLIPIAGPWMRYAGYLPIKQGDIADGQRIITMASHYAKDLGHTICVAPEGTRNKDFPDVTMLPFHPGTFRLALDSKVPLVMVAVQNTNCILKRFPRHRTHVYLDVVGVMNADEYEGMSPRDLAAKSHAMILARLEKKDARFYHFRPKKKDPDAD